MLRWIVVCIEFLLFWFFRKLFFIFFFLCLLIDWLDEKCFGWVCSRKYLVCLDVGLSLWYEILSKGIIMIFFYFIFYDIVKCWENLCLNFVVKKL